jgi:hypothetical protein
MAKPTRSQSEPTAYRNRQALVKALREVRDGLTEYQRLLTNHSLTGWPVAAAARRLNELAEQVEHGKTITA